MKSSRTLCFLLLTLACSLWHCTDHLKQQTRKALKDDQGISAGEFADLRKLVTDDAGLKAKFPDDSSLVRYMDELARAMSQAGRRSIKYPVRIETGSTASSEDADKKISFDFYYENSASMDGFLNGKTEFIDATLGLMTRVKLQGAEVNLHYINTDVYPVDSIIQTYTDYLSPATVRKFGRRGSSEINHVLKTVADSVVKHPDHIAVVISDYIYSIQGKKVRDQLDLQKNTTALSLAELPRNDYAVLIVKINSDFNGTYYDMLNQKVSINEKRPVYFWIIGKRDKIIDFPKQYRLQEFITGYETHLVLLKEDKNSQCPYYSVLDNTFREGRFYKSDRGNNVVTVLEDPQPSHDGVFQLGVAVDFSKCPALDSYLSDSGNYEVTSDAGDKYKIKEIHPITDLVNNDKDQKGTATHILVLTALGKISKGRQTLSILLKKQKPAWVESSSTESDATPEGRQNRTFGLQHLVDGAIMSFDYNKESTYHSFPITIKN